MRCPGLTSGFLFLFCLGCALGQDIPTQPEATPPSGANQMDSQYPDASTTGLLSGIDISFLDSHIDRTMNDCITTGDIPGGVVLIVRDGKTVFHRAYGKRAVAPVTEATTLDTIYDLASLTKSVATATSIMMLVEQGKIRLNDSVKKFIPEWKNSEDERANASLLEKLQKSIAAGKVKASTGKWDTADTETAELLAKTLTAFPDLEAPFKVAETFQLLPRDRESITIRHLLTHTSGLPSFLRYYEKFPEGGARKKIVADIAAQQLRGPVGGQFIYSDLGFIVLGDIVERVSGQTLDDYSHEHIFQPLGMNNTMFAPSDNLKANIAPTEWRAKENPADGEASRTLIRGEVHDGNAWVQDGVSGHAGLFSNAEDLGVFCKMLLNGGTMNGKKILSPITIQAMTRNFARLPEGEAQRGLGWDLTSSYASLKGDLFEGGYGHTGFTGTSLWLVPEEKLAVIILSNRVHPDGKGDTTPLRARIANIVAGSITKSFKQQTLENQ